MTSVDESLTLYARWRRRWAHPSSLFCTWRLVSSGELTVRATYKASLTRPDSNVLGGNFALVGVPSVGASGAIFGTTAVSRRIAPWRLDSLQRSAGCMDRLVCALAVPIPANEEGAPARCQCQGCCPQLLMIVVACLDGCGADYRYRLGLHPM